MSRGRVRRGERERENRIVVGLALRWMLDGGEKRIEVSGPQCRERRVVVVLSEL